MSEPVAAPVLTLKGKRLEQLALSWRSCTDCALARSRTLVVFHRGNPDARIAIIGDAPGQEEDSRGIPFVGVVGKVLDSLLSEAKVAFDDVCYLNMVGCRAPAYRAPLAPELVACSPRTVAMIRAVDPVVLLLLGRTAASLAKVTSIGPWRGMPTSAEVGGKRYRAVVSYHPSFLIREHGDLKIRQQMVFDIKVAHAISQEEGEDE